MSDDRPPALTRDTDVSLMPDFLGFSVVWTMVGLMLVVLSLGIAGMISLGLVPWMLFVDIAVAIVIIAFVLATPSHLAARTYYRHLMRARFGQQAARHDSFATRHFNEYEQTGVDDDAESTAETTTTDE